MEFGVKSIIFVQNDDFLVEKKIKELVIWMPHSLVNRKQQGEQSEHPVNATQ